MPPKLDLSGQRFGMLTALSAEIQDVHRSWLWRCRCDCGATPLVRGATLVAGRTSACASCANSKAQTTHGLTGTPIYSRWRAMLDRTGNPKNAHYKNYGARGIVVCERWEKFENFESDMAASFSPGLQLDRIDNDGPYAPGNCRWVTHRDQQRNKRTNHIVEYRGCTRTVQEWSELLGVKPNTIVHRLRRGWPVERALNTGTTAAVLLSGENEVPS